MRLLLSLFLCVGAQAAEPPCYPLDPTNATYQLATPSYYADDQCRVVYWMCVPRDITQTAVLAKIGGTKGTDIRVLLGRAQTWEQAKNKGVVGSLMYKAYVHAPTPEVQACLDKVQ